MEWKKMYYSKGKESKKMIEFVMELLSIIAKKSSGMAEEKAEIAFRYFAASVIYSNCISYSSLESFLTEPSETDSEKYDGIRFPHEHKNCLTLQHLNFVAEKIVKELKKSVFDCETIIDRMKGKLASIRSPGNIPFMHVYSNEDEKVSIRRGFEYDIDPTISECETKRIITADEELSELPTRVFQNGIPQSGHFHEKRLSEIISDNQFREDLLKNKYITWIHVSLEGPHTSGKVLYEIDIIDKLMRVDTRNYYVNSKRLESFAGRKRLKWERKRENGIGNDFSQEDILISYFSNRLFESSIKQKWKKCECTKPTDQVLTSAENVSMEFQCNYCQFLFHSESWCNEQIRKYTAIEHDSKSEDTMYIGFCFRTLLEGGYGSQEVVNGAKNLLLLALVRGIVKLSENLTENNEYRTSVPASTEDKPPRERRPFFYGFDKEYIAWRNFTFKIQSDRKQKHFGVVPVIRRTKHPLFIGATNKSITIKAKFPFILFFLSLFGVAVVLGYTIPMAIRQRSRNNLEEFFGSLAALISATTGLVLLVTKCIYKKWKIVEMWYRKRTTYRLTELSKVIYGGKSEAIKLCCSIDQPKKVFSQWMSCAFAHEGEGEFEIDEKINVEDLKDAGMLFGVDYYGRPIVSDPHGKIRQLQFYNDEPNNGTLHVGGDHELKIEYLYKVPIKNLEVGSRYTLDSVVSR